MESTDFSPYIQGCVWRDICEILQNKFKVVKCVKLGLAATVDEAIMKLSKIFHKQTLEAWVMWRTFWQRRQIGEMNWKAESISRNHTVISNYSHHLSNRIAIPRQPAPRNYNSMLSIAKHHKNKQSGYCYGTVISETLLFGMLELCWQTAGAL